MFQPNSKKPAMTAGLFASFMLAQLLILRMGNQAGRGLLTEPQQELVYLFLQCAVIPGFLIHAPVFRRLKGRRGYAALVTAAAILCCTGGVIMLFAPCDTVMYLTVTGLTVFFLGITGGAVYLKLAFLSENAAYAGLSLGAGYAAAVAMQYFLQLRWTVKPALFVLLALCCGSITFVLRVPLPAPNAGPSPRRPKAAGKELAFAAAVTFALLLFTSFYNGYINRLQVATGYTDYNVYTWPRLLMIPTVLLFGLLGDVREGRYLPLGALCVSAVAILNTSLLARETYLLNMCLYYVSLSAVIVFYHLVFLRMASRSGNPALWAPMGRVLDSVNVLFCFALRLPDRAQAAVLLVEIAALSAAVGLMAVGGAFDLSNRVPAAQPDATPPPKPAADPFEVLRDRYGLTPGELRVFRELVTTEDKQNVIGDRLSIKVRTVQANVTAIYRKTGVSTRAGLVQLFQGIGS